MNIEWQVQHRLILAGIPAVGSPPGAEGKISGIAPGCSLGVPPVGGSAHGVLPNAAVARFAAGQ
jgi:hypothetical protein